MSLQAYHDNFIIAGKIVDKMVERGTFDEHVELLFKQVICLSEFDDLHQEFTQYLDDWCNKADLAKPRSELRTNLWKNVESDRKINRAIEDIAKKLVKNSEDLILTQSRQAAEEYYQCMNPPEPSHDPYNDDMSLNPPEPSHDPYDEDDDDDDMSLNQPEPLHDPYHDDMSLSPVAGEYSPIQGHSPIVSDDGSQVESVALQKTPPSPPSAVPSLPSAPPSPPSAAPLPTSAPPSPPPAPISQPSAPSSPLSAPPSLPSAPPTPPSAPNKSPIQQVNIKNKEPPSGSSEPRSKRRRTKNSLYNDDNWIK